MPINIDIQEPPVPASSEWYVSQASDMVVFYGIDSDHAVFFDIFGNITVGYISDEVLRDEFFPIHEDKIDLSLMVKI